MRTWLVISMCALLAGCGGGESGSKPPPQMAADACEAAAKSRLSGKLYELDIAKLAASMTDAADGAKFLTAPILIEPGLTSEVKQIVECTVRFTEGKNEPDVTGFVFNW